MKLGRRDKNRTHEQIKEHYEIEKELAARLRHAPQEERRYLYSLLYNELFDRVPHHPQLIRRDSIHSIQKNVAVQLRFLRRFLRESFFFLELGPGDCSLSLEVSKKLKGVLGLEVSAKTCNTNINQPNFLLILYDGCSIPISNNSIDIVYCNQVIEHLHPEDVYNLFQNVFSVLKPNGLFICITPNRLNGPHDISKYFDKIASGFHLKEYTNIELFSILKEIGFSKIYFYARFRGYYFPLHFNLIKISEAFISILPYTLGKTIASIMPFRNLLGIRLVAVKPP